MSRVVIIGSGLGGLSCGVVLAKHGHRVTVLEQGAQAGGCLQCFERRGVRFETGMHFIGSASQGQTLDRMLRYLEVRPAVALEPLDTAGYDTISLMGQRYRLANGREAFISGLTDAFPRQRDCLERYFDLVERVASASRLHSLSSERADVAVSTEYQLRSIDEVIGSVVTDPLLQKVLVGNLPLYAAGQGRTAFATHAFITDFYNQSAYRVVGGSDAIARQLTETISRYGGEVRTLSRATRIVCDDSRATGVEVNGEQLLEADLVISDAHPQRTLELLDTRLIRPAYRQRIGSLPQTVGAFTVYLHFRDRAVRYMNTNFYGYRGDTPWGCEHYDEASWPKGYLYMHLCHEARPQYARAGVIMSYMQWQDVARWMGTEVGRRGQEYEDFKRRHAERLIEAVEHDHPGLSGQIAHYYTSTPLTYRDYTGTEMGGMYGVAKDITLGQACRVAHRTKVPNVLLTGQNINSHGILGVLVGTMVTCREICELRIKS